MSKWLDIVNDFNDNEYDFLEHFGNDISLFLDVVQKKGFLSLIDPFNSDDYENVILLSIYKHDKEKFIELVLSQISDVVYENGKFYMLVSNLSDLSSFFCENRNSLSRGRIEDVLSGDYDYPWFDDTTDNVYSDVINELSPKNIRILQDSMIHELKDTKVGLGTELLESIADEQGNDYVIVDEKNIGSILDDEETTNFLLEEYLHDIKSSLYNIHSSAYGSAYESELYDSVMDQLLPYLHVKTIGSAEVPYYSGPPNDQKVKYQKFEKIEIVDFLGIIVEYLDDRVNSSNQMNSQYDTLSYFGSFSQIFSEKVSDSRDCPIVYPPDYPDSRDVDKNINEYFADYM